MRALIVASGNCTYWHFVMWNRYKQRSWSLCLHISGRLWRQRKEVTSRKQKTNVWWTILPLFDLWIPLHFRTNLCMLADWYHWFRPTLAFSINHCICQLLYNNWNYHINSNGCIQLFIIHIIRNKLYYFFNNYQKMNFV